MEGAPHSRKSARALSVVGLTYVFVDALNIAAAPIIAALSVVSFFSGKKSVVLNLES